MAEKKEVMTATGFFGGQTSKGNFDVQFKMEFREDQLGNALQFVSTIGKQLLIVAYVNNSDEKVKLGKFMLHDLKVDRNANCKVTFKSNVDSCFVSNFEKLLIDEAIITLKAVVSE